MIEDEVSVIALVENLELVVPARLPRDHQTKIIDGTSKITLNNLEDKSNVTYANKNNGNSECKRSETLELLRSLPPGTLLIKQVDTKDMREESNKGKIKMDKSEKSRKVSQRMRNKTTLEVRRNPLRSVARRDNRTSRRLLTGKRKNVDQPSTSSTNNRRTRNSAYMNTRSVTRKLCNVGATYEAPTSRDACEWRQWPVHGMHERPVYHPQFGLAAEYNGRLFTSFDGESYREITPEQHIEIVRVDPHVDSLDHRDDGKTTSGQKICSIQTSVGNLMRKDVGKFDIPDLWRFTGRTPSIEYTKENRTHQQQQLAQLRNLGRFQHLENLQRLSSRVRLQNTENTQQKFISSRLLSKDVLRNVQNSSLVQQSSQQNPSKCLIVPKNSSAPVTLPFCGVQTFKGNPKGKLFFIRASDASKRSTTTEKSSTLTSATQNLNISLTEMRKKMPNAQTYTMNSRSYQPIRINESSKLYRQTFLKSIAPLNDPGLCYGKPKGDDLMSEVLDLSKKELKQTEKVPQNNTTDLVRYFQTFSAEESVDLFEDPKNLT